METGQVSFRDGNIAEPFNLAWRNLVLIRDNHYAGTYTCQAIWTQPSEACNRAGIPDTTETTFLLYSLDYCRFSKFTHSSV